jgi:hypothetical protein
LCWWLGKVRAYDVESSNTLPSYKGIVALAWDPDMNWKWGAKHRTELEAVAEVTGICFFREDMQEDINACVFGPIPAPAASPETLPAWTTVSKECCPSKPHPHPIKLWSLKSDSFDDEGVAENSIAAGCDLDEADGCTDM